MIDEITGYCVRCKEKRPMQTPREVAKETKRGPVNFLVAECPVCPTKGKKTEMWRVKSRGPKKVDTPVDAQTG